MNPTLLRSSIVLCAAFAFACSGFRPASKFDADAAADDASNDAESVVDAGSDAEPFGGHRVCPNDSALAACFLFDGNGGDGSGNGNDVAIESGVDWVAGLAGSAARLTAGDRLTIDAVGTTFDAAETLTIEAWLLLDEMPTDASGRVAVFDKDAQYSLFLTTDGRVQCNAAGRNETAASALPIGRWFHVACVVEDRVSRVVLDGSEIAFLGLAGPVDVDANRETDIGSDAPFAAGVGHLVGQVDNLLVWRRALSGDELCSLSGACPQP